MALIEATGLTKVYGAAVPVRALAEASFAVEAGQVVVILGPSGSGKTTLLNLIGGLDRPTEGTLSVAGVALGELDGDALCGYRRAKVGFVFQFFNLIPSLTARENVLFAAELNPSADPAAEATRLLDAVGLGTKADRFPSELSGGEQQRVAIARALAKRPAVLLCDEPTGALDQETGKQVLELLRGAAGDGCAVLIVTHNSALARIADRVVRLKDGRIASDDANDAPLPVAELTW